MSIPDTSQVIHYSTCPKCQQTTKAQGNEEFHCHTCNEDEIAVPRCKVVIELQDNTRTIGATLFDKCAERLLDRTAGQIHSMDSKEIKEMITMANQRLWKKNIKAQIRASGKKFTDQKTRYNLHDWIETDAGGPSLLDETNTDKHLEDTPEKKEQKRPREVIDTTSKEKTATPNTENPSETDSAILKKVKLEFPDQK